MKTLLCYRFLALLFLAGQAAFVLSAEPYKDWPHSGSFFVMTTPEGADLPASASEEGFPLLVRLHKDFFDFSQAKSDGADIRFSTKSGDALPYQIDFWDAAKGSAAVWVRLGKIQGNSRQELRMHWGKTDAASESNGKAVFNKSNGYLSVWHMNGDVKDEVGTLDSKDVGTTPGMGVIGEARHLAAGQGIFAGDKIQDYPVGSESHSTQAWFRAEKSNGRVVAWGNEHAQGKVVMHYRSPPHVKMECYFSGADVDGQKEIPLSEWVQVVHTYRKGDSRLYVNGVLDRTTQTQSAPLAIKCPARLWIGGWYNNYDFVGNIDEVRISSVPRSADWVKLEYENQKPSQTLVGPLVQTGDTFSVSQNALTIDEGKSVTITAKAGGAQKVFWILKADGKETIAATDRFSFTFNAGRVVGNKSSALLFKAIYPNEVKSKEIPVIVREAVPEPVFTLDAPAEWDGRKSIEVLPKIQNLEAMKAKGVSDLRYSWKLSGLAATSQSGSGKLILTRAQKSGPLTATLSLDNGGQATTQSVTISVKEPAKDAWVNRTPAADEKPVEGQFFARDDKNEGTLFYNGTLAQQADSVLLKLYADGKPIHSVASNPNEAKVYSLSVKLKPGLVKYKIEFASVKDGVETVLDTVSNLVCGDAYLIDGQSNAEATDVGKEDPPFTSEWIRSFGSMAGDPNNARLKRWGIAVVRDRQGGKAQIGYWGMELAKRLLESQKMPICIINGAVGGSRIDVHQRNHADPTDVKTIYGRLLWRVREAGLTTGIRGVFWHQGENDQGADGPTGGYGYETYQQYFLDMAAGWKTDYPNIQNYYVFQIWPKACSMGVNGSDNRLREVQRNLPKLFSNLSVMSTLGIQPPGGCHFPKEGYAEFARLIQPLVERDQYGKKATVSITAPDLRKVSYAGDSKSELLLEFDQPVRWDDTLIGQFYLDGIKGRVVSGSASGNSLRLKLAGAVDAKNLTYLDSASWSTEKLLRGENGIAALTFCEVPIAGFRK